MTQTVKMNELFSPAALASQVLSCPVSFDLYRCNFPAQDQYFTLYNVCSVPWRDIMTTMGIIMNTVGDVQYSTVGDIMIHVGGYRECRGWFSVPWGILSFVIWCLSKAFN